MMPFNNSKQRLTICIAVGFILLITAVAYYSSLHGQFVWDDESYIANNHFIKNISLKDLKRVFTVFNNANYHPLTILTYSWEYFFFGLNPLPYHIVNILLHLIDCVLVFFFLFSLTKSVPVAFIAGLLFGIHPLHVESVAWISELKDVLYTLFFMTGLISYLAYLREGRTRFYIYALFLFLLSLLSKPMAMSFPIVLFLIDYFKDRKGLVQIIKEKIPFLALSVIFGMLAIASQQTAIQLSVRYSLLRGTFIASYGLIFYIVKMFFPFHLTPLYHYPYGHNTVTFLSLDYMLAPLAVIMLGIIVFWSRRYTKKIVWGTVFYLVTLFPAIQFIPVGHAKAADRYTYVPSIGIFFIVAIFLVWLWKRFLSKNIVLKSASLCIACLVIFSLAALTVKQIGVWKNNRILWAQVLTEYPHSYVALNNLGIEYHRSDPDKALQYYKDAIYFRQDYADPYINTCNLYQIKKELIAATTFCMMGIEKNQYDRATSSAYVILGDIFEPVDMNLAFSMYQNSTWIDPGADLGHKRLCNLNFSLKNYRQALPECSKAVRLNPDDAFNYQSLGNVYMQIKEYDKAIENYRKALSINPRLDASHHNLALIYFFSKQYDAAIKHYKAAVSLGMAINPEFQKTIEQHIQQKQNNNNRATD